MIIMMKQIFAGLIVFTDGTETNLGDEVEAGLITQDLAQYFQEVGGAIPHESDDGAGVEIEASEIPRDPIKKKAK